MGAFFGIHEDEDLYIWDVASMALSAPLMPGWAEEEDESGQPSFKWVSTDTRRHSSEVGVSVLFGSMLAA